jgi:hypothetical protein
MKQPFEQITVCPLMGTMFTLALPAGEPNRSPHRKKKDYL